MRVDVTSVGLYCRFEVGKYRVTIISNGPDEKASQSSVSEALAELPRLEERGYQKFEARDFGDVACWHAENGPAARPRASEPNDACVQFTGGKLHLVIASEPPGRHDLSRMQEILREAAGRRPR
jgi:hypothetical protein